MYKLGPVHQGIVERGSKTGSETHLLWPARIGALSMIKGQVYSNSDISEFPFSYVLGDGSETVVIPGKNLSSVGIVRDAEKWNRRDNRNCQDKLDLVNTDILSPCIINQVIKGIEKLESMKSKAGNQAGYINYRGVRIKHAWLNHGQKRYRMILDKFVGDCLVDRLKRGDFTNENELRRLLKPAVEKGAGQWVDIAGMYAPADVIDDIVTRLCSSDVDNIDQARGLFNKVYARYDEYRWRWAVDFVCGQTGESVDQIAIDRIPDILREWKRAAVQWYELVLSDAGKEFSDNAMTSYGMDGDKSVHRADFEAVRGTYEGNKFVKKIRAEIEEVERIFNELCEKVQKAD
jgi:rRNA-processing protein FCF1